MKPSDIDLPPNAHQTDFGTRFGDVEFVWAKNSKEFLFSNSIVIHGENPIIVDPSASFTYIEALAKSHAIKTVLNTHYHADHRSLNHLFKGVTFAAPELEADAISNHAIYAQIIDPDPNSFYSQWRLEFFQKYKIVECPVSVRYKPFDVFSAGDCSAKIIPLPGHTPGHSGLYFESIDCLFTSDIDLTPHGPWYANLVSDLGAFKKTVSELKNFKATWFVTSHGERIYDRENFLEKLLRFESHFAERDERILNFLKTMGPTDLGTLCSQPIIYKTVSLTDPLKAYFQFQMIKKHLEELEQTGQIKRFKNGKMVVINPQ